MIGQRIRKIRRVGRELDRISRGLNTKIAVHIADGNRRPEAPMQAAKLASEAGIIIRNHIPIFTHWKHYKDKQAAAIVKDYEEKVTVSNQPVLFYAERFIVYVIFVVLLSY